MNVLPEMTVDASTGQDNFSLYREPMAGFAANLGMCAYQGVLGFLVVEIPGLPGPGVMTLLASQTKPPLVNILLFVAGCAGALGVLEGWRQVALLAFGKRVLAGEREARLVVIVDHSLPFHLIMAVVAARTQLSLVPLLIVQLAMTGNTLRTELLHV